MARRPLTLLCGGSELARLVGQLVGPPHASALVGSTTALTEAGIRDDVGVRMAPAPEPTRLAAGIVEAVERFPEAERLIVVLDEDDDVAAATFSVLTDEVVHALVRLDGIVATVDAVHLSTRLMAGQPVEIPRGLDRLAIADRILVARGRDVTPSALGAIAHVLRSVNRTGPIIAPAIARCSPEDLFDLDAWSGSPAVGPPLDRDSPFLGPDAPSMVVCRAAQPIAPEILDRWLDEVLTDHASRVLRLLGAVSSTAGRRRTCLHGVRSCLLRSDESVSPLDSGVEPGLVALVGRQLPADELQRSFLSCHR